MTTTERDYSAWEDAAKRAAELDFFRDDDPDFKAYVGEEAREQSRAFLMRTVGRPRLGDAPGTGRSPKRQVRLSEDLDEWLSTYARLNNLPVSEVIRQALQRFAETSGIGRQSKLS